MPWPGSTRTRPEWCVAGCVQAVPRGKHRRRNVQLQHARKVEKEAEELAKAFRRSRKRRRSVAQEVQIGRELCSHLTWTVGPMALWEVGRVEADDDFGGNPYLQVLLDDARTGRIVDDRTALIAYCMVQARRQR